MYCKATRKAELAISFVRPGAKWNTGPLVQTILIILKWQQQNTKPSMVTNGAWAQESAQAISHEASPEEMKEICAVLCAP